MEILHIREPFYSAGKKFNWTAEHKVIGLGIRRTLLIGEGTIRIKVGDSPTIYEVDKQIAREVSSKYKSSMVFEGCTVDVIPWDICRRVEKDGN